MRKILLAIVAAAATMGVSGQAQAATLHAVSVYNPYCWCYEVTATYTAWPGEGNHVVVDRGPSVSDAIPFPVEGPRDRGAWTIADVVPIVTTGEGCSNRSQNVVSCGGGGTLTGNLGDRNDSLDTIQSVSFSGGTGDDRLIGSGFLTGADGNDTVEGSGELRGGNGDDTIVAIDGIVHCGAGTDKAAETSAHLMADCETQIHSPL